MSDLNGMQDKSTELQDKSTEQPSVQTYPYPMKWHKFLIYFALFASMLLTFVNGFNQMTGNIYLIESDGKTEASLVYAAFPNMKAVDIALGVAQLGMLLLIFFARQGLAEFRKNGPKLLLIMYGAGTILDLASIIAQCMVTHIPLNLALDSTFWTGVGVRLVLITANAIYYNKRASLFKN